MTDSNRSEVLRALADLLEAHPEVEMPYIDCWDDGITEIRFQLTSHEERAASVAAAIMKAFPGKFTKEYSDTNLNMFGQFAGVPVKIAALRADVCVARQIGTKKKQVKDPEALKAVPLVEVEVPVYEYDCKPILGDAA